MKEDTRLARCRDSELKALKAIVPETHSRLYSEFSGAKSWEDVAKLTMMKTLAQAGMNYELLEVTRDILQNSRNAGEFYRFVTHIEFDLLMCMVEPSPRSRVELATAVREYHASHPPQREADKTAKIKYPISQQ